jgi:hypothetical protein
MTRWKRGLLVLPHRLALILHTTTVGLLALATVGGSAACSDTGAHRESALRQTNAGLNTASQKTLENSASFVDVPDAQVSLPRERVIYPPSTGNGGTAAHRDITLIELLFLVVASVGVVTMTRVLTADSRSGHRLR